MACTGQGSLQAAEAGGAGGVRATLGGGPTVLPGGEEPAGTHLGTGEVGRLAALALAGTALRLRVGPRAGLRVAGGAASAAAAAAAALARGRGGPAVGRLESGTARPRGERGKGSRVSTRGSAAERAPAARGRTSAGRRPDGAGRASVKVTAASWLRQRRHRNNTGSEGWCHLVVGHRVVGLACVPISEKEVTSLQEDCPCFAAVSGNGFSNASPIPIIDQKSQEIQNA